MYIIRYSNSSLTAKNNSLEHLAYPSSLARDRSFT